MIKVKEFKDTELRSAERQLNSFLEDNKNIQVIDIKYQVLHDTIDDIIMTFALLIYKIGE